ncbi:MAG: hypothetical protein CMH56_02945 [Myxococcales bacterium]|nr:hypothetical protein [Myxococcales bacterium]
MVHDASVVQSFCDSELTDGGVSDEGPSLRYGALSFGVSWYGNATYNGYYAGIDNVFLDRENQIEIELISLGGRVVQSSTLETGFRVESAERIERIRIWLRTDKDEDSPSLSQLHIVDATPLGITIAEQPRAVFDKSRIGLSGALPPKADWDDASLMRLRSYCLNTLDDDSEPAGSGGGVGDNTVQLGSDAAPHCWDFLSDHGAGRIRTFFPVDALDFAVNEDGDNHDVVIQNTSGYERTLNRFIEMVDRGLDVLLLLMPLRQGASPNVFSEGLNAPSDFYADPVGTDGRSGDAQIRHLNALLSAHVAGLFDGQQSYTSGSTSMGLPLIDDFETFNEINISSIDWTDASGLVDLQNESCQAVAEVRTDANISSSGLSAGDAFFPTEYVLEHLGDLDETSFTHNNFHPYAQGGEPPENIGLAWLAHWEAVNDAFPNNTWGSKGTYLGEYGFSHFKYDPFCYLNNQTGKYETASSSMQKWVRGYGDSAFSKLVARATLKALQQPVDAVFYWSAFTNGDEAYGGDYACWKRHDTLNHHLFQEAENLEFTSTEQSASVFQANDAGEVWLRLASHLGGLNPHSATLERLGHESTRPDEHYYAAAFSAGEERYLAVWWYKNYNYGSLKTDSNSAFLNYITGTMDDGFEEKRTHNLVLQQNISEVERATLIDLQSGVETELDVERDEQDLPVLRQVPVGEMPTLIRLH